MQEHQVKTEKTFVSLLTRDLIAAAGARRQGVGRGSGDRSEPSLAAAPVDLVEIEGDRVAGSSRRERITEPGARTAVRKLPAFLSGLHRYDGRRLAAVDYVNAVERVGAVRGATISAESEVRGSSAGVSDGGATSRVRDAAVLRLVRGVANRWKFDRARRSYVVGASRAVLSPQRGGNRRAITAIDLLDGLLVEGLPIAGILRRAGWSAHSKHCKALTESAEEMIEEIAIALGYSTRIRPR